MLDGMKKFFKKLCLILGRGTRTLFFQNVIKRQSFLYHRPCRSDSIRSLRKSFSPEVSVMAPVKQDEHYIELQVFFL